MLVKDITCTSLAMISKITRGVSEEVVSKTFTSLVLKGKIHSAVRFATLRGAGGVLLTNEIDLNLGRLVIDVIFQEHPAPIVSAVKVLKHYNVIPEFVPLNVTKYTVKAISRKLTGAADLVDIDAVSL